MRLDPYITRPYFVYTSVSQPIFNQRFLSRERGWAVVLIAWQETWASVDGHVPRILMAMAFLFPFQKRAARGIRTKRVEV